MGQERIKVATAASPSDNILTYLTVTGRTNLFIPGNGIVGGSLTVSNSFVGLGTINTLVNQTLSGGSSIITRDLGDARYALASSGAGDVFTTSNNTFVVNSTNTFNGGLLTSNLVVRGSATIGTNEGFIVNSTGNITKVGGSTATLWSVDNTGDTRLASSSSTNFLIRNLNGGAAVIQLQADSGTPAADSIRMFVAGANNVIFFNASNSFQKSTVFEAISGAHIKSFQNTFWKGPTNLFETLAIFTNTVQGSGSNVITNWGDVYLTSGRQLKIGDAQSQISIWNPEGIFTNNAQIRFNQRIDGTIPFENEFSSSFAWFGDHFNFTMAATTNTAPNLIPFQVWTNGISSGDSGPLVLLSNTTALGGLAIGTGQFLSNRFTTVQSLDFGTILAAAQEDLTVTVTGARTNSNVAIGLPPAPAGGLNFFGFVSNQNSVVIRAQNVGSIATDAPPANYRITVDAW